MGASSPARVVAEYLRVNGVGHFPPTNEDWKLFLYKMPSDYDSSVCVYNDTPMLEPRWLRGGDYTRHDGITVRIRHRLYDPGWAKGKAIEALLAAIRMTQVTIAGDPTAYRIQCFTMASDLSFIGEEEDKKRQLFTLAGRITLLEDT